MGEVTTIGLDLAKHVFQVHGVDAEGATVLRKQLRRAQVLAFFSRLPPCLLGLEACATAYNDSSRRNATSGDRPHTTSRRLRHGSSALMQGLAFRKNHRNSRNPQNNDRRAMQGPAWLGCHTCHTTPRHV